MEGVINMKKILVEYEVSEELLDTVYAELEDLLDNGDDSIRVTAYQTYTMDENVPDIMKREEV